MPYDFQLVGGILVLAFAIVAIANAFVERRSKKLGFAGLLCGIALIGWAWVVSEESLTWESVPNAFYRVIAKAL